MNEDKNQQGYIPYGEQWRDELRKLTKEHIISLYRMVCLSMKEAEAEIKILKKELGRE